MSSCFILLVAIAIGYGATLGVLIYTGDGNVDGWQPYLAMMASSLLLGCVFLAVGYLISALVRERAVAIGAAVASWLVLVVLYDLALLTALLIDEGKHISESLFSTLMLINPADAYRLFNFKGFEATGNLVGASNLELDPLTPLLSMALWVVVPFILTVVRFHKQELQHHTPAEKHCREARPQPL